MSLWRAVWNGVQWVPITEWDIPPVETPFLYPSEDLHPSATLEPTGA